MFLFDNVLFRGIEDVRKIKNYIPYEKELLEITTGIITEIITKIITKIITGNTSSFFTMHYLKFTCCVLSFHGSYLYCKIVYCT